jgi:hypothetical protein
MASMASVKGILRLECLGFGNEIGIPRLLFQHSYSIGNEMWFCVVLIELRLSEGPWRHVSLGAVHCSVFTQDERGT